MFLDFPSRVMTVELNLKMNIMKVDANENLIVINNRVRKILRLCEKI